MGINIARNQIFFAFIFHHQEINHNLTFSNISEIISHHFQSCFLSYRTMNPNHKKRIQLMIQYNNQIHNRICTIITKLQNHIQKLKNISCQRNWLNFIIFLSIRLQSAENHNIRYIHKLTKTTVLKIVIMFQNSQIGFHFILLWINQNIHAQTINRIIRFLIFILELAIKYKIGNAQAHNKAETIIHRFCHEDSIDI